MQEQALTTHRMGYYDLSVSGLITRTADGSVARFDQKNAQKIIDHFNHESASWKNYPSLGMRFAADRSAVEVFEHGKVTESIPRDSGGMYVFGPDWRWYEVANSPALDDIERVATIDGVEVYANDDKEQYEFLINGAVCAVQAYDGIRMDASEPGFDEYLSDIFNGEAYRAQLRYCAGIGPVYC